MSSTQSASDWLRARTKSGEIARDRISGARITGARSRERTSSAPTAPVHERDARAEIGRLRDEIENLVSGVSDQDASHTIDTALDAVARLQVVTANLDACKPPLGDHLSRALQDYADKRLTGHADAIERGMTYTSDNTMRLLRGEK